MTTATIQPYIDLRNTVNIEQFCEKWIPRLYGIEPDERGFKKYCAAELVKVMGGRVTANNIIRHWVWKDGQSDYPDIVDELLTHVDARYSTIEANCGLNWLKAIHKQERETLKGKEKEKRTFRAKTPKTT
jgi:hypothetical protein